VDTRDAKAELVSLAIILRTQSSLIRSCKSGALALKRVDAHASQLSFPGLPWLKGLIFAPARIDAGREGG
jgi:hypothetical protein